MKNFKRKRKLWQSERNLLSKFLFAMICSVQMLFALNVYGQQAVTVSGTDIDIQNTELAFNMKNSFITETNNKGELNLEINLQQPNIVKGKVVDGDKKPLPGVTIVVVGETRGVITDVDGNYSIEVRPTDKLVFSFVGMENQIIDVGNQKSINVEMKEKIDELEEVTIVAFGKQKKESIVSAISTIDASSIRVPSSNLTTAFAGKIAGMISYQTSGEPGQDDASYFIRGITSFGTGRVNPLILIDNVEVSSSELSRLHPDDIRSFSVLKDATSAALYGARGANGVILVTTKEGSEGKVKVSFRAENSFSTPTSKIEIADAITYMRMANEAEQARNPLAGSVYSQEKIENTQKDLNPYIYPNVDWMGMLIKDYTTNQRANLNISGGGNIARYYVAGSFSQDNGILNVDKRNDFNSNIDLKKYSLRTNINVDLTKSTELIFRIHGTFEDYTGPRDGGSAVYRQALNVSPVLFPAYYAPDELYSKTQHILFGNDGLNGEYLNPYASMVSGYKEHSRTIILGQLEMKQDLSKLTPGLSFRMLANTSSDSYFDLKRGYSPFYYNIMSYDRFTDKYSLFELNSTGSSKGSEYLSYTEGAKNVSRSFYSELLLDYNRSIDKHDINGMIVFIGREDKTGNDNGLINSLPHRNLGLSGRFSYGYDQRYFSEFNFGYNGSEKFDKKHRWGFFPSVGFGWIISNEKFWEGSITNTINKLKLRGTYGLVGNDNIGDTRFFYLSSATAGGGGSYQFGLLNAFNQTGWAIDQYPNNLITWQIAYKTNLALELGLFKDKLNMTAEYFNERRTQILMTRTDIPVTMGLWQTPQANIGAAKGKGFDIEADYKQSLSKNFWLTARGTFTYARSLYEIYEEIDYALLNSPYLLHVGHPISQTWGYVAERLFIDEADVANSPKQDLGSTYMAGDLKYKDINGDGIINSLDKVPIGYPKTPEINYGFGTSLGYNNFDFSFFFHGSARSSFIINAAAMAPFIKGSSGGKTTVNAVAKFIADDYWTVSTQNPTAKWPRLSSYAIANNNVTSTWWLQDGNYLRLKNIEIGYTLPFNLLKNLRMETLRIYISGTNLLLFSPFKTWDVELGANGFNYPIQKVWNIGLNASF